MKNKTSVSQLFHENRQQMTLTLIVCIWAFIFPGLGNQLSYGQANAIVKTDLKDTVKSGYISRKITGTVVDESELPLPGVSIRISGIPKAQTDFDGKFSLEAGKGDTLSITYATMKTKTVVIGKSSDLKITLYEGKNDEIVSTGTCFAVKRTFFGHIFYSLGNLFRKKL